MAVDHQQLFKDNFAKREVLCLNVLCSAQEHGCSWHGELRDLQVRTPITNCYWWGVDGVLMGLICVTSLKNLMRLGLSV